MATIISSRFELRRLIWTKSQQQTTPRDESVSSILCLHSIASAADIACSQVVSQPNLTSELDRVCAFCFLPNGLSQQRLSNGLV
jgi:hypothetical protein